MPAELEMTTIDRQIGRYGSLFSRPHSQQSTIVPYSQSNPTRPEPPRLTRDSLPNLLNQRQFAAPDSQRQWSQFGREFCPLFPHISSIGHQSAERDVFARLFLLGCLTNRLSLSAKLARNPFVSLSL
jgi:hypothetical protein